jgi:ribosomal protein L28
LSLVNINIIIQLVLFFKIYLTNMTKKCMICGKTAVVGSSKQHRRGVAGKRWKKRVTPTPRLFKPNLQKYNGKLLCAKCIKRLKKEKANLSLQV